MSARRLSLIVCGLCFGALLSFMQAAKAQASAPPPAEPSSAPMGGYSENVGLYVFVVGVVGCFGLGVIAGGKR